MNWFRKGADGKFLWPGYGENVRVLKWMLDRIEGKAGAVETPIGLVPEPNGITLDGLRISLDTMGELLRVDSAEWSVEADAIEQFFMKFGYRLPSELWEQHSALTKRLGQAVAAPAR